MTQRDIQMEQWYKEQNNHCIYCWKPVIALEPHVQNSRYEFYRCECPICYTVQTKIK